MTEFLNPQQLINQFDIKQGMRIADFGCGSGNITIALARLVGQKGEIIAIDILKSKLESVQSNAVLENLSNIKLIRANLEITNSSKLDDQSVDLVLLANILFQSPNQKAIINEAERVVRKNGRIVIVDWKPEAKFGPKTPFRTSKEEIRKLVSRGDPARSPLNFEKEIPVGDYHFGLVFRK